MNWGRLMTDDQAIVDVQLLEIWAVQMPLEEEEHVFEARRLLARGGRVYSDQDPIHDLATNTSPSYPLL